MINRLISLAIAGAFSLCLISAAPGAQGSGCMPTTGTVSGLTFAQDVNAAIAALISNNSGASAPATDCSGVAIKFQWWPDTSVTPNILKMYDNSSWLVLGAVDASQHVWSPPVGGGTATVTAASTADICAAPSAVQTISGTTPITSFGTGCPVGVRKTLIFASATPITYDAVSMILPGQRSYTATAGDMADVIYLGSGNWRFKDISKIDGSSIVNPAIPLTTILYGAFPNIPAKTVIGDGRALSRASYPDYLTAVTRSKSGTLTSGNSTIASITSGDTRGLGAGMPIEGTGIQSGTVILSATPTTIVMSKTATANGVQTWTAFPTGYGSGGDSSTVGVQNCVGKVAAGLDPSAAALSSATAINSSQGSKNLTLARSDLPNSSVTVNITDPGHTHTTDARTGPSSGFSGGNNVASLGQATINNAFTGVTAAFPLNGGVTQTLPSLVQPTVIAECVVAVLP
jgi:hypothetical protein